MNAQFQFRNHFFQFLGAVLMMVLIIGALTRFTFVFPQARQRTTMPEEMLPASPQTPDDGWQVLLSQVDPAVVVDESDTASVEVRILVFHDRNLDGLQGSPDLTDAQVRLFNVEDYSDVRLFTEETITGSEVRLCLGPVCKSPDENGLILFQIPQFIFNALVEIPLRVESHGGRYPYFTFNAPNTVLGKLENQTIILTPQYAGSGELALPTYGVYTDFSIGFSPHPCVLPFDESAAAELVPMNFFDFHPDQGEIISFDGELPRQIKEVFPDFGNYNSDNHAGLDIYYPREEQIIRYSCIIQPDFLADSSSDTYGNLVFALGTPQTDGFILGFGHVSAPSVAALTALYETGETLRFGQAFASIGSAGSSINHLHLSFGDFTNPALTGGKSYCVIPPLPYIAGDAPFAGVQLGISQLEESICFNYDHVSYLSHAAADGRIYASFIPSIPLNQMPLD